MRKGCRVDLLSWGAKWDKNCNRPYFEGHERVDVVEARTEFVYYFLKNKQFYYHTERDEKIWPVFKFRGLQEKGEFCKPMMSQHTGRGKCPKVGGFFRVAPRFSTKDEEEV